MTVSEVEQEQAARAEEEAEESETGLHCLPPSPRVL